MRRLATATLAGLTVFGLVNGLAASMTVTGDQLGSAADVVTAACDGDGMTMSLGVTQGATHSVTQVTFSGVDPSCHGQTYFIDLLDIGGASIAEGTGPVNLGGGTSFTASVSGAAAASVEGAVVTITGADATPTP